MRSTSTVTELHRAVEDEAGEEGGATHPRRLARRRLRELEEAVG